jgi:hypothetical protein
MLVAGGGALGTLTTRSKSSPPKMKGTTLQRDRRAQNPPRLPFLVLPRALVAGGVRVERARADVMSARKRAAEVDDEDEVVLSDGDDDDEPAAQRARVAKEYPPGTVLKARACVSSLHSYSLALTGRARAAAWQKCMGLSQALVR